MKSGKFYFFILFFLCLFFWQSSLFAQESKTETETKNNSPKSQETEETLIHQGDLIDVDIIGSTEYDWRGTITPEGNLDGINYTENTIYALCKTEDEVAVEIAKAFSKILREPKVEVKIIDRSNRPVSVLYGAIKTPQRFQLKRAVFLNELLIVSGGMTDKASGDIEIFRPQNLNCIVRRVEENKQQDNPLSSEKFVKTRDDKGSQYLTIKISDLLTGKKNSNPQIFGGDIITVAEADSIYVIGGVANPKQIYFRSQITLSRALDSAGGLTKDAIAQKVSVLRKEGTERKTIEVDYEKIKNKQTEDVILKPFDIIEVSQKGRGQRKLLANAKVVEKNEKNALALPLRMID